MCLKCFFKGKVAKVIFNIFYFVLFFLIIDFLVPNSWANIESGTNFDILLNSIVSFIVATLQTICGIYLYLKTRKSLQTKDSKRHCWAWEPWC